MSKLIIFDWDGTLFDSIDRICTAMVAAGKLAGAGERTKDDIKEIIGLGLNEALTQVWPEADAALIDSVAEHYRREYVALDHTAPAPYEGVIPTLQHLHDKGHQLAVATGKSRRGLERVMDTTGTRQWFVASRCADETKSKPHPLMLLELLEELNLAPEDAIMVGDTEYDLSMASNAGMRSIGVSYGAHHGSRLLDYRPLAVVDRFSDIVNVIEAGK